MTERIMGSAGDRCVHGVPLDKDCMGCDSAARIKAARPPAAVPPDLQPLIPDTTAAVAKEEVPHPPLQVMPATMDQLLAEPSPGVVVQEMVYQEAKEAEEVAQSVAKVALQFPAIGFIDPVEELEKMRRLANAMNEGQRALYPEQIRAKLLAYQAKPNEAPEVTDEELALAIFIKRTHDSPLTEEDLEAKATGKKSKTEGTKTTRSKKEKVAPKGIDDILGGL
jgi:hypothetical protein